MTTERMETVRLLRSISQRESELQTILLKMAGDLTKTDPVVAHELHASIGCSEHLEMIASVAADHLCGKEASK